MVQGLNQPPSGNGELDPAVKKKLKAILDTDPMSTAFTQQHITSAIEKFVDRGDKPEDFFLRGFYRDVNHMNACIRLYRKAVHFQDEELQDMILNHMAAYPAIGGMRIDILLQAVTGFLHQKQERDFGSKIGRALGLNNGNRQGPSN